MGGALWPVPNYIMLGKGTVMLLCGWESNHRSGITLPMPRRLCDLFSNGLNVHDREMSTTPKLRRDTARHPFWIYARMRGLAAAWNTGDFGCWPWRWAGSSDGDGDEFDRSVASSQRMTSAWNVITTQLIDVDSRTLSIVYSRLVIKATASFRQSHSRIKLKMAIKLWRVWHLDLRDDKKLTNAKTL